MKNKLIRIILLLLLIGAVVYLKGGLKIADKVTRVEAFGDLVINFGVPAGDPVFVVENMLPGDTEDRNIIVTNNGTIPHLIAVAGVKTQESGNLSTTLDFIISEAGVDLYGGTTGTKKLADFFNDSIPDGVFLNIVNPGQTKTYNFKAFFPQSAGNEFQNTRVVFDLIFKIIGGDNLVINEVYYQVDEDHGMDSPKDRGLKPEGAHASNAFASDNDTCFIFVGNSDTDTETDTEANSNTGGNTQTGNGNNQSTGEATAIGSTNTSVNSTRINCGKKLGQNDEWIELYNPTYQDVSLKNWTLTDNSGNAVKINANKIIEADGFALISKDSSTWKFWDENKDAIKVELGKQIGDGLDNSGDHILLKDPNGNLVDVTAWQTDTFVWNPAIPQVTLGASIERLTAGFDFDLPSDWEEQNPPTPGI